MKEYNFISRHFPAPDFLDMPFVGIDISPVSVRMMEIIDVPTPRVGKYAEASLTRPFAIDQEDKKEITDLLKKWKKEYKLNYIKASLPEEHAYLFDTEVEYGTEEKMRSAIEFSLEENVPLNAADVIFDFRLAGMGQKEGFVKVAVTVLPSKVVTDYLALFEECGLQPISFLLEAQAITRALITREDQGTYLVANLHHTRTGMFIVSKGAVQFTSTVAMGSGDFNRAAENKFSISTAEAEAMIDTKGFVRANDSDLLQVLIPVASQFQKELEKVLVYWSKHRASADQTVAIQKIILSGKEAMTPGFKEYLSQTVHLPVETGNVWSNLASFEEYIPPIPLVSALNFGAAIGLALPENE